MFGNQGNHLAAACTEVLRAAAWNSVGAVKEGDEGGETRG